MERSFTLSIKNLFAVLTVAATLVLAYASNTWDIAHLKRQVQELTVRVERLEARK